MNAINRKVANTYSKRESDFHWCLETNPHGDAECLQVRDARQSKPRLQSLNTPLTGIEHWWATQNRDPRGQLEVVLTTFLCSGESCGAQAQPWAYRADLSIKVFLMTKPKSDVNSLEISSQAGWFCSHQIHVIWLRSYCTS